MSRGHVAIVYPRSNIDSVPSLAASAELLAQQGFDVDVLTLTLAGAPAPRFASSRISTRSLGVEGLADQSAAALRGAARLLPKAARAPLARCYIVAAAGIARGSRVVARARTSMSANPYDCLIGVDPDGLVLAHSLAAGAPVAYFSLELLLSSELRSDRERELKQRERALSRAAPFVIVQDEQRGRLLAQDNGLNSERLVFVPNSPPGRARRRPTRAWHQRLGLPDDTRIVLHAGSVGDWTGIDALVDAAPSWPEPWVLVVHTRYDATATPYIQQLVGRADTARVRFSLQPVPRQEYDALVDGADVGVAFYVATGDSAFTGLNLQTLGLSSGKLAHFLRAGLPVIVNDATSVAPRVVEAQCGVAVSDALSVGPALTTIGADYAAYSARACAFFDRELQLESAFARVVERLDALRAVAA